MMLQVQDHNIQINANAEAQMAWKLRNEYQRLVDHELALNLELQEQREGFVKAENASDGSHKLERLD